MTQGRVLVSTALLLLTAACGGSNESPRVSGRVPESPTIQATPEAEPACPPESVSLEITASKLAFDKECLTVPAHKPFTVRFTNADSGGRHNFTIHGRSFEETFLAGKIIVGVKTITSRVKGLEPGEWLYHCDLHPGQMKGTLVVSE